jgi:ABC-2 type transport system ATP-binding protein
VSIVREGRIAEHGTLARLRQFALTRIEAELDEIPDHLTDLPGVHAVQGEGTKVTLQVEPGHLGPVMRQLADLGIRSLVCQPPSLDELFLQHYRAQQHVVTVAGGES